MTTNLFMVAGEASADMHAAALLKELKKKHPGLHVSGVGGAALLSEGINLLLNSEKLNVVGISDWWDRIGEVLGGYKKVSHYIQNNPPDFAVLLDLPDFNLRLAKKLKRLGVPVIYYISPQVWAWRKYRIQQIKRDVDLMLVVFPFEKEFYDRHGVPVVFVGHPLLEAIQPRRQFRNQAEILSSPRIAVLPGSRRSEVRYHAPILNDLCAKLRTEYPNVEIKLPVAHTLSLDFVKEHIHEPCVELTSTQSHEVIAWADVAVVASGTATLETALIGTPFSLFYKVSKTSAWIYRNVMSYRGFIGMPNLLHQKEVIREFFQDSATSQNIFEETNNLLKNEQYRNKQVSALSICRQKLGVTGANERAAEIIHQFLVTHKKSHRSS